MPVPSATADIIPFGPCANLLAPLLGQGATLEETEEILLSDLRVLRYSRSRAVEDRTSALLEAARAIIKEALADSDCTGERSELQKAMEHIAEAEDALIQSSIEWMDKHVPVPSASVGLDEIACALTRSYRRA